MFKYFLTFTVILFAFGSRLKINHLPASYSKREISQTEDMEGTKGNFKTPLNTIAGVSISLILGKELV